MTATPNRRPEPRGEPEIRAAALREKLLVELRKHNRTTNQLTTILDLDKQVVYRGLLALEERGLVTSFMDRRNSVHGVIGKVWAIAEGGKSAQPIPARDPLLWALFGSPP